MEDTQGKPFVGPSGRLLGALFSEVGITEPMGVCNTVSCNPHDTPTWEHTVACEANKWAQLDYLSPTYVLVLGAVALRGMRRPLEIKHGRARPFLVRDRICFGTYHPAAALRNSSYEDVMRRDLTAFKALIDAGPDAWMDFVPDTCAGCTIEATWFEQSGLGWCRLHLPSSEFAAFNAREAAVAADMAAAKVRRDVGVAQVEANADDDWLTDAFDALVAYLQHNEEFFVDDWWKRTQLRRPRESRALGPVVMKAARDGLMEKSGGFRKSTASNLTEKPVWRSLIFQGPA